MFTIVALLDRNLSPVDAIKNSFETVKNNLGNALLAYLIIGVMGWSVLLPVSWASSSPARWQACSWCTPTAS